MKTAASLRAGMKEMGISRSYASEISTGIREPGQELAIKIYRKLGVKLGPIAHATKAEIDMLERLGARRVRA